MASRQVERQLHGLPRDAYPRVLAAIRHLAEKPRPEGVRKLHTGEYRVRIGRHRVIYDIRDREQVIIVNEIALRNEQTYRRR